jgi:hypothetical protein
MAVVDWQADQWTITIAVGLRVIHDHCYKPKDQSKMKKKHRETGNIRRKTKQKHKTVYIGHTMR